MSARTVTWFLLATALAGCAAAPGTKSTGTDDSVKGTVGKNPGLNPKPAPAATTGDDDDSSAAPAAPAKAVSEVFGHSDTTLYKLNPDTKAVTVVADFKGCDGAVLDIALDEASHFFATTEGGLYTVDSKSAQCTQIAAGSYPNSLSFVPKGTVDANAEALVGYEGSDYIRIDTKTGAQTTIGSIGSDDLTSSGDIVSAKGGSTYLTVTGDACDTDCLIEVDPKTGALKKNWGATGFTSVFGLAYWAGKVYGFDQGGDLFSVSLDGGKLTATAITVPKSTDANAPALSFWGAGSTTSAPVASPH